MTEEYAKRYAERKLRCETAVANKQPDRVPNVIGVGSYPIKKAGLTMAEAMIDHEAACQAMLDFYTKYSYTDTASVSNFTPAAKILENLDSKTARWPGDPKGLDVNNTYQFIEFPTLEDGEYDEFFDHPAEFWLTKHLPRTLGLFEFTQWPNTAPSFPSWATTPSPAAARPRLSTCSATRCAAPSA